MTSTSEMQSRLNVSNLESLVQNQADANGRTQTVWLINKATSVLPWAASFAPWDHFRETEYGHIWYSTPSAPSGNVNAAPSPLVAMSCFVIAGRAFDETQTFKVRLSREYYDVVTGTPSTEPKFGLIEAQNAWVDAEWRHYPQATVTATVRGSVTRAPAARILGTHGTTGYVTFSVKRTRPLVEDCTDNANEHIKLEIVSMHAVRRIDLVVPVLRPLTAPPIVAGVFNDAADAELAAVFANLGV